MSLSHRVTELMESSYNDQGKSFGAMSKDNLGKIGMNTIFGEVTVGERIPYISQQFMYKVDDRNVRFLSANGGSVTFDDSMLNVNSGTNIAGDGLFETKNTIRYIPGHESYMFFTSIFATPVANSRQEIGLYDGDNGFWIGYIDTDFVFVRVRDSVEYITKIEDFNIDIVNGNNAYNFVLNAQKGNIWKISYGYLGFANIHLEVLTQSGSWIGVHTIEYTNMNELTHVVNTYLPFRCRSINNGNNTNVTVRSGSISSGLIDGGMVDVSSRRFSVTIPAVATGTNTPIAVFRNKETFEGKQNHIESRLLRASISSDGAQSVTVAILKDVTITNTPTWIDVDADNSTHEYATDATVSLTGSVQMIAFELAKVQNYVEDVQDYSVTLYPGETAVFLGNGNNSVKLSINWKELF